LHTEKTLQDCRLCKSSKTSSILEKDDVYIFKCLDCGIVFLGNELNQEAIKDLYKYYAHNAFSNHLSPVTRVHYERLLDGFEKYRKNNTILDVGCGAGYFMVSAAGRGWQVEGTEISDEAITLSEEKGQRAFKGDITGLGLEREKYDIAVLMELLEHASDPEGIVRRLMDLLRRGGGIYITTPNFNGISRRLLGNRWGMFGKEHLFYFTPKILASLLEKRGFRIKKIRTENLFLIEISKLFKGPRSFNISKGYERQERLRDLTEKNIIFSIMKNIANFILNIFKAGDTIYITAEK